MLLHPGITFSYITAYAIGYTIYHVGREKTSVFCLLPCSPHRLDKVFGGNSLSAREVSGCDLRIDFNTRVHRNQVFYTCLTCQHAWQAYFLTTARRRTGDIVALENWNTRLHNCVVFPA